MEGCAHVCANPGFLNIVGHKKVARGYGCVVGGKVGSGEAVRMSVLLLPGPELHTNNINTLIYYKWTSIILVVISAFQSHRVELDALVLVPFLVDRS